MTFTDYYHLSTSYPDAVAFVPKRDVLFHGFGILQHYDKKDVTYKIKWVIDTEESEWHDYFCPIADKDEEKNWHEIKLANIGVKPIKVSEGQDIHCLMKVSKDDERRTTYGSGGYVADIEKIKDQDFDFITKSSSWNTNSSSSDWG